MSETKELLRPGVGGFEPMPDAFERVLARRDRKQRNQRVAAGVVGIAVFALAAIGLVRLLGSEGTPASDPRRPFEGTWVSTSDADGGTQTMTVRASGDDAVEIVVTDDVATVCGGTPSTMAGTGQIVIETQLVIPAPDYRCDDGSEPQALSGPPLEEQLRDLTFDLDAETETLSDTLGGVWEREGAEDPSTTRDPLADLEPVWPQTSLDEVRQAQELADVGDPAYTWQVDPDLRHQVGQHHPSDGEIFVRFLEEELGWETFLWDEAFAHPDGLDDGEVVYIRCAPGQANPLYPADPESPGCAPTIDELHYETVHIQVAQLDRQGPQGIWVVTGWEIVEPVAQADPRVVEAEATALLEDFLQARIDGVGAEELAGFPEYDPFADVRPDQEIPLLYATSTGAPYERSEFDVVDGPAWPGGEMRFKVRLFAENDQTVVEQAVSLGRDERGRLRLVYEIDRGFVGPGPGTTENGKAVPVEYAFLDGEVTYRAAYPEAPSYSDIWEQGPEVTTIIGAHERRVLLLLADPRSIGPGCEVAPSPGDAEALARSIRSDSDLEADAPVVVTIGGIPALQMDVVMRPGATDCPWQMPNLSSSTPLLLEHAPLVVQGADRARLFLLDLPGGSARVLAIAVMSDRDSFEQALRLAEPIVDSIEFHAE